MKNKTWLWILLALLIAILLWLYLRPAAPDAPVATVGNVVDADQRNDNVDDATDDSSTTQVIEDDGQTDAPLPNVPLADSQELDSFDDTLIALGTRYLIEDESQVLRAGNKVAGAHNGYVEISDGELYVENGQIVEGRFVMDMTTIKATDIDDSSLDNTLKEWFNTEEYPTASFQLNESTSSSASGIMTINGQSREISFPATIIVEDDTVIANANFALDRTQWGVDGGTPAVSQYMELSFNLTWSVE